MRRIPRLSAHSFSSLQMNSGPLSILTASGFPRHKMILFNSFTTRWPLIEVSIAIPKASRLKSSITLRVRNLRPLLKASCIKSMDQVIFGPMGNTSGSFTRAGNRFLALFRMFSFNFRYIRYTRLWFQLFPWFLRVLNTFQNPQSESCFNKSSMASMISPSWLGTG